MNTINNVLAIVAHPDDLEIMAGGTILKWISEGKKVHVLIFCDGTWTSPGGVIMRNKDNTVKELKAVADFMEYSSCEVLGEKNTQLIFKDSLVCEVLKRIEFFNIDTIITSWSRDTSYDHAVASTIAKTASRRVPNFFECQINYYLNDFFTPNVYVDISSFWERKLEAVKLYTSQWERAGKDWEDFMDVSSRYYGKIVGVKRAEGLISSKSLL